MGKETRASSDIEFRHVTKKFGSIRAVDRVDLTIPHGGFFSFLGPSGCGKTTSLRLIAGFEQPSEGDVLIEGRSVVGVPAYRRPVNMVFQHYALFPHLNIFDNIAYGLRQLSPRPDKREIAKRVGEALELVRLSGFEDRRIWELSGGQQQRVALARALINHPAVLLLDEPLAALDRKLRREMQIELQSLQRDVGITFVLVTHDQEEALSMSDTICIMREGRIVQTGGPNQLYDEPINGYVADFVGKSNFLAGRVTDSDAAVTTLETPAGQNFHGRRPKDADRLEQGTAAQLAVRPEVIKISQRDEDLKDHADVILRARVRNRIFLGEQTEYLLHTDNYGEILVRASKMSEARTGGFMPGQEVVAGWPSAEALVLTES